MTATELNYTTAREWPRSVPAPSPLQGEGVPRVSVIVPSRDGRVERVLASLRAQTFTNWDLQVVVGVAPAARARNRGVAESSAELLLFLDDDAYLGHERVLERLVETLCADPTIGVVGPSKILSPGASALQRRIAAEVPRWVYPIVDHDVESNPPLGQHGFSAITTTCCLMRRDLFTAIGAFDEALPTGEDTELFYRVRSAGYRFVVPAHTWVHHDPPGRLSSLLRKCFAYGVGHALEARKAPERGMAVLRLDRWHGRALLALAPLFVLPSFVVGVQFDPRRRLRFGLAPLRAVAAWATLLGYARGWFYGAP